MTSTRNFIHFDTNVVQINWSTEYRYVSNHRRFLPSGTLGRVFS